MKRRYFLGLSLIAAVFATALPAAESAPPLRVMTYNIHHGEGVDEKLDLARIAKVITDAKADLVALQEVDQKTTRTGGVDQAAEIARLAGLQVVYGKAMDYQGGAYGQALLSRWPLTEVTVHALPNPAKVEPRIAVSALVKPPGQPELRFVGTHLDATRDDAARFQQAAVLIELFANDPKPVILVGDLNSRPETRTMKALLERFTDTSAATPEFTIPSKKPTGRIDFVLLNDKAKGIWKTASSVVVPEAVASDHRPVVVELAKK